MQTIEGKAIAKKIREETKAEIARIGFRPGLGAILVGNDPASRLYVSLKEKACREVGLEFTKALLPENATAAEVAAKIDEFNSNEAIDAFIIQLPLPKHLNEDRAIAAMLPSKDADGFHRDNLTRLIGGQPRTFPVLPQAVTTLIASTGENLSGKNALIISNSRVFYEPLETMLKAAGLKPNWVGANDPKLNLKVRQSDVLVVAVGQPGLISGGWLKNGAIAVDIGTNRLPDGTLTGDIDQKATGGKDGWITPVPGGVGPVTVALLLKNTVELAKQHRR
ncbi:bifunctional 5,10-methylenetetrahydrofolate dehydrogenase/5,10-methenyltetrahydrofolate cyclohydrolase [Candidatus Uhrbacteria bacterium]|nr:bifunctional 5,10-methylenetetrahydrofolate dehydrogenase/5,10-methenyltetrahydrofolate cyclohydrolase [Candidatus Uhrbacteria bacterium]